MDALLDSRRPGVGPCLSRPPHTRDRASAPSPSPIERFLEVRAQTLRLTRTLSAEDQCVQSMPDASPVKWHLAHTSWFFEALILQPRLPGYRCFDARYAHLFNSYYESLGPRHARHARGLLTRPALGDVLAYRQHVDTAVVGLIDRHAVGPEDFALIELGLHHEQQHQELMLTDIKHAFYLNPLRPAYQPSPACASEAAAELRWLPHGGGVVRVGHGGPGFAFDNECPRHEVLLRPFELAARAVTCGEYRDFIEDGGYARPEFWLSDGFAAVAANDWQAPLYWQRDESSPTGFELFTLHGMRAIDLGEPVCHMSFYEANAYAAWAGARLPTEFEWEAAADAWPASSDATHPALHPHGDGGQIEPMCGRVWQWTRSSYDPYPGFQPNAGVAGEYNGKFMVGQLVLRGGSCITPGRHIRNTYRNFFAPSARWQFSGLRLARDA